MWWQSGRGVVATEMRVSHAIHAIRECPWQRNVRVRFRDNVGCTGVMSSSLSSSLRVAPLVALRWRSGVRGAAPERGTWRRSRLRHQRATGTASARKRFTNQRFVTAAPISSGNSKVTSAKVRYFFCDDSIHLMNSPQINTTSFFFTIYCNFFCLFSACFVFFKFSYRHLSYRRIGMFGKSRWPSKGLGPEYLIINEVFFYSFLSFSHTPMLSWRCFVFRDGKKFFTM